MSNEDNDTPDAEVTEETAPASAPPAPPEADGPPWNPGDTIRILGNRGTFYAVVEKRYDNYADAEADYELSFQTITCVGPLYDYNAPHYLCHLANPGKKPAGACELDTKLKARCRD